MAVKFKNTININDQYTFPTVVGTDGQYLSITDAAAGTLDWTNIGDVDGSQSNFVYYDAKNSTGSTIPVGTAVMAVGTDGNSGHILIAPMVADGSVEAKYFIGVTDTAIDNGVIGKVVHFGTIDQVNTNAFSNGDVLWCDPANPGGFTTTEPQAPSPKLAAAIVLNSSTNGKLLVRVQGNEGLHELHDVKLTSITDGDTLVWDDANGYWKNGAIGKSSLITDNFTGDDSITVFTLSSEILSENNTSVYFDGVYQSKSNYSLSGDQLTFATAPPIGTSVEVVSIKNVLVTEPQASDYSAFYPLISDLDAYVDGSGTANYVPKWTDGDTIGNSVIYDDGTNIGISTSSPSEKLDVVGNAKISGNLTVDTDTLYVAAAANRVGIGTSSPQRVFSVNSGGIQIGSIFESNSSLSSQINIKNGNSTNGGFIKTTGDNIILTANNTGAEHLVVADGGNVGIGTTSPSAKTHIYKNATIGNPASPTLSNAGLRIQDGDNSLYFDGNAIIEEGAGQFEIGTITSDMVLYTNASERMRIDSSGNVSIKNAQSNGSILNLENTNTSVTSGNFLGKLQFVSNDTSSQAAGVKASITAPVIGSFGETDLVFSTAGYLEPTAIERMRITSTGNVGIGTTSPSQMLTVWGGNVYLRGGDSKVIINNIAGATNQEDVVFQRNDSTKFSLGLNSADSFTLFGSNTSTQHIVVNNSGNVGIGTTTPSTKLQVVGTVTATALTETSALRFKENIQEDIDASIIDKLRPVSYDWKEDKKKDYGFIAEEVNELDSTLTTQDKEGEMIGIKYTKLIPFLVKKIQEQEERIKQLENGKS